MQDQIQELCAQFVSDLTKLIRAEALASLQASFDGTSIPNGNKRLRKGEPRRKPTPKKGAKRLGRPRKVNASKLRGNTALVYGEVAGSKTPVTALMIAEKCGMSSKKAGQCLYNLRERGFLKASVLEDGTRRKAYTGLCL